MKNATPHNTNPMLAALEKARALKNKNNTLEIDVKSTAAESTMPKPAARPIPGAGRGVPVQKSQRGR